MAEDPRWNFLQEAVQKTLNIKADKWAKYIGNEGTTGEIYMQIYYITLD